MDPLVSHVEYAPRTVLGIKNETDRRTNGRAMSMQYDYRRTRPAYLFGPATLQYHKSVLEMRQEKPQLGKRTERASFSVGLDNKRRRLADDAALETGAVRRDLGRLGRADIDDERALGDGLTAERDRYDVLADLLGVIAARERRLVHLYQSINRFICYPPIDSA